MWQTEKKQNTTASKNKRVNDSQQGLSNNIEHT